MSVDLRLNAPIDQQQRIVFDADDVELWEFFRQPQNEEFGVYNGSTGEIVLRFLPAGRPVVSGSWSDGSAARSVLAALVSLRLVVDETTE
jgi:hypothetical protein